VNYGKINNKISRIEKKLEEKTAKAEKSDELNRRLNSILDGIMHETRRLNSEISAYCEELTGAVGRKEYQRAEECAETMFFLSGLISSRLTFADFELNPQSLSRQSKVRTGIYRKFDKTRRVLHKNAKHKKIKIDFHGNSYAEVEAIQAFELVPFVILDNAIKYSPQEQPIKVEFQDRPSQTCIASVVVSSVGPTVSQEELNGLVARGARGKNAIGSKIPGDGIGLFLAEMLCKGASASLKLESSKNVTFSLGGVDYSEFKVSIDFK
jgi:K+-sensing histidine kinase KdpD